MILPFCQISVYSICVGLFWGSLLCLIKRCVYSFVNTILFDYCSFTISHEIKEYVLFTYFFFSVLLAIQVFIFPYKV